MFCFVVITIEANFREPCYFISIAFATHLGHLHFIKGSFSWHNVKKKRAHLGLKLYPRLSFRIELHHFNIPIRRSNPCKPLFPHPASSDFLSDHLSFELSIGLINCITFHCIMLIIINAFVRVELSVATDGWSEWHFKWYVFWFIFLGNMVYIYMCVHYRRHSDTLFSVLKYSVGLSCRVKSINKSSQYVWLAYVSCIAPRSA